MKDVPDYCEHSYYSDDQPGERNPEWLADPCCNGELRQYQCCAPKDIPSGEIDVVLGIDREQVSFNPITCIHVWGRLLLLLNVVFGSIRYQPTAKVPARLKICSKI